MTSINKNIGSQCRSVVGKGTKYGVIIISLAVLGLSGCGQKGGLYLVDSDSQQVLTNSDAIASTSQPQDAAFADLGDDSYERERYLEEQQILPEPSTDPNDY